MAGPGHRRRIPDKPAGFGISALSAFCVGLNDAGVRLSWSAADGADGYEVLRDGTALVTLGAGATEFSDTAGLTAGETVPYQVRAVNAGGETLTEAQSFTVPAGLCDVDIPTPPAPVTDLAASFVCGPPSGVQLTWTAVAGATAYVLQRDHLELATLGAEAVSYADSTVRAGDTHTYVLHAVNDIGLSLSAPVLVAVPFAQCGLSGPTVAAGERHSLAIAQDGTVWAWGGNANGQLGFGAPGSEQHAPVQVPVLPLHAVDVVATNQSSYVLLENGNIWAWGGNWVGQLGDGTYTSSSTPKSVSGLTGIVGLGATQETVLAHTATGEVYGWGSNGAGQLGYWDPNTENQPRKLPAPLDVTSVFAGSEHSLVVAGGRLYGAGSDVERLLGMGQVLHRPVPAPVPVGVPLAGLGF